MAKILAFAGSNSSKSINYKLVGFTVSQINGYGIQLMDMANCPFPMYSQDYEEEHGFSNSLIEFSKDIKEASGIIISVNEHNSNLSAYFKNFIDWLSRLDRNFIDGKNVLLMSTSPGKRGAKSALEMSEKLLGRFGANITGSFSLPSFNDNFNVEKGIVDFVLAKEHKEMVDTFLQSIA